MREEKPHENAFEAEEPLTTKADAMLAENGRERQSRMDRAVKRTKERASKREEETEGGKRYAGTDKPENRYSKRPRSGSFSCQAVDNESRSSRREARCDAASIVPSAIREQTRNKKAERERSRKKRKEKERKRKKHKERSPAEACPSFFPSLPRPSLGRR